jgi:Radical SAM superfamily
MAATTEAAILLDAGVLYGRRVLFQPAAGDPIFVGFKPGTFSIYIGDTPFYHLDLEGRWQRALVDGVHYLKALDTTVQSIDRMREGKSLVLKRRTLSDAETEALDARVRFDASALLRDIDAGSLTRFEPTAKGVPIAPDALKAFLDRVVSWDSSAWRNQRVRYHATYRALPFVPPDCTSPVILQATLADRASWVAGAESSTPRNGRCQDENRGILPHPPIGSFARTARQFEEHVRSVSTLLGRRVEQCKTVFLGGPDVLLQPSSQIAAYLEIAARRLPVTTHPERRHPDPSGATAHTLDGIHAFLDTFGHTLDWPALRTRGLVRVSLGIESGDPLVRTLYGKTWTNDALRATVSALTAAGIGVSPIVWLGAGGSENASNHLAATSALISTLELGPGDVVALVDAEELQNLGASPPTSAFPLPAPELDAQRDALKTALAAARAERKFKVVPYSFEKQGLV